MNMLQPLRNRYFVMRHGESRANVVGLIVATPENGLLDDYGLTDIGINQAKTSAQQSTFLPETIIYSSDFSRARQTAQIVATGIGANPAQLTPALRERHFGRHELQSNALYQQVWNSDAIDPAHHQDKVESVHGVVSRVRRLIDDLEQRHEGQTILLVSLAIRSNCSNGV